MNVTRCTASGAAHPGTGQAKSRPSRTRPPFKPPAGNESRAATTELNRIVAPGGPGTHPCRGGVRAPGPAPHRAAAPIQRHRHGPHPARQNLLVGNRDRLTEEDSRSLNCAR